MRVQALAAILGTVVLAGCAHQPTAGPVAPARETPTPVRPLREGGEELMNQYLDIQDIRHDRALTLYQLNMDKSRQALAAGDYDRAIEYAKDALAILDENRDAFGAAERQDLGSQGKAAATSAEERKNRRAARPHDPQRTMDKGRRPVEADRPESRADRDHYRTYEALGARQSRETVQQQLGAKETEIPYSQDLTYPPDWPEKTRLRQGQ